MKVIICGANGAMGQLVAQALAGDTIVGRVSMDGQAGAAASFAQLGPVEADVIIDFSHHSALDALLDYALAHRIPVVIGTTGHTEAEKDRICRAAREIPLFFSGNMSLGIAMLCRLAKEAAKAFPQADIEIVEVHHSRKADAPSGTAKMLFDAVKEVRPQAVAHYGRSGEGRRTPEEIGIASLRMGNVVGIHEIHICTPSQTLTLRHEAHDRAMFAQGAVEAARFLLNREAGLYNINHLVP